MIILRTLVVLLRRKVASGVKSVALPIAVAKSRCLLPVHYRWSVAAALFLAAMIHSGASEAQSLACPISNPPSPPLGCVFLTQYANGSVTLQWGPIPGGYEGNNVAYNTGYVVTATADGAATVSVTTGGSGLTISPAVYSTSITGLTDGLTYTFTMVGSYDYDPSGTSESASLELHDLPTNAPSLTVSAGTPIALSTTANLTWTGGTGGGGYVFVGHSPGSETYYAGLGTTYDPANFAPTSAGTTCFQVGTTANATFAERSNEACVFLLGTNADSPTLPEWAAFLLGVSLLGVAIRFHKNLPRGDREQIPG